MGEVLLTYERLSVAYGGVRAVCDASLAVKEGVSLGIVGQSGSGKSTLVRAALGLLGVGGAVTGGRILYMGEDLTRASSARMREVRGVGIGMVFQDSLASFVPVRTVGAQMVDAVRAHDAGARRGEVERTACDMLARMGVCDPERVLASYPFELSGGLGQRAGIAAALLLRPRVLFADEPTSALDTVSQRQVIDEMSAACERDGVTLVVVTHNMGVVRRLAGEVAVMSAGCVVEKGSANEVFDHPVSDCTRELLAAVPKLNREVRA